MKEILTGGILLGLGAFIGRAIFKTIKKLKELESK